MVIFILPLLTILAAHADIFKHKAYQSKEPQTRYLDFQIFGDTITDYTQTHGTDVSFYTLTNIDTDFNFNDAVSIDTRFEISNTNNGLARGFSTQEYINSNNDPYFFFGNHGIRSRVLALSLKTQDIHFMVGKIVPRSGVGASRYNPVFNNNWYGVYGTTLNTGYQNTDKIGIQAEFHKEAINGDTYNLQFALFKNDTTPLFTEPLFSNLRTNGFLMPANIANVLNKPIAGDTTIPQSFLVSFNGKTRLPSQVDTVYYGIMLRRQDIGNQPSTFAAENSIIGSGAFERDFSGITAGVFGEVAHISNAYAIKNLTEKYYTASFYSTMENVSVALVYNKYFMSSLAGFGILSNDLSQVQFSLGYALKNYAFYIAYRNTTDNKSKNTLHGIGLDIRYNIGTKNTPFNKM